MSNFWFWLGSSSMMSDLSPEVKRLDFWLEFGVMSCRSEGIYSYYLCYGCYYSVTSVVDCLSEHQQSSVVLCLFKETQYFQNFLFFSDVDLRTHSEMFHVRLWSSSITSNLQIQFKLLDFWLEFGLKFCRLSLTCLPSEDDVMTMMSWWWCRLMSSTDFWFNVFKCSELTQTAECVFWTFHQNWLLLHFLIMNLLCFCLNFCQNCSELWPVRTFKLHVPVQKHKVRSSFSEHVHYFSRSPSTKGNASPAGSWRSEVTVITSRTAASWTGERKQSRKSKFTQATFTPELLDHPGSFRTDSNMWGPCRTVVGSQESSRTWIHFTKSSSESIRIWVHQNQALVDRDEMDGF